MTERIRDAARQAADKMGDAYDRMHDKVMGQETTATSEHPAAKVRDRAEELAASVHPSSTSSSDVTADRDMERRTMGGMSVGSTQPTGSTLPSLNEPPFSTTTTGALADKPSSSVSSSGSSGSSSGGLLGQDVPSHTDMNRSGLQEAAQDVKKTIMDKMMPGGGHAATARDDQPMAGLGGAPKDTTEERAALRQGLQEQPQTASTASH